MHAASFWCLLSYAMWATVPPPDVVNDVMLSRILAGSSPISTGDDDGLPFDWVLLAQSVAVQSPLWLAMIGIVLRREVVKWAKAPYIHGHGTDFFAWNDSVFEAHFCFTKDDVCRMRRALEIPTSSRLKGREKKGLAADWSHTRGIGPSVCSSPA